MHDGRAIAIAALIRGHGPRMAAEIVAEANRKHREINPDGCGVPSCPVCSASREQPLSESAGHSLADQRIDSQPAQEDR